MARGHAPGVSERGKLWRVTVTDAANERIIHHQTCEDWKECQCIATEARSQNLSWKIWINPPIGRIRSWD